MHSSVSNDAMGPGDGDLQGVLVEYFQVCSMTKAEAIRITGGLSVTTKMPCYSYGLPDGLQCPTGGKLMLKKGTVCANSPLTKWGAADLAQHSVFRNATRCYIWPGSQPYRLRQRAAKCYAQRGQYRFRNVVEAQHRRLKMLQLPQLVDATVRLIEDILGTLYRTP